MTAFYLPADDFEAPDEPWFCEARDDDPRPEFDRQVAFLAALARQAPAVKARAFANSGRRSEWEKVRRWREGMVAGSTDLVLRWNHGTFWAEFKDGRSMPSKAQREELNSLCRDGFRCGVYRRPETLLAHLREAGAPFL
jgi:hypothetical protein